MKNRPKASIGLIVVAASLLNAQQTVPVHSVLPVILVDGYDMNGCRTRQDPFKVFGNLIPLLNRDGARRVVFFDNCMFPETSIPFLADRLAHTIEDRFGAQPVDVVAYSMGGLIVRTYLMALKGSYSIDQSLPQVNIRKLILIGTPNYGSGWGAFASNPQGHEMAPASRLFPILNQSGDLQDVDVVQIAGLGTAFGDGVVSLKSAALNSLRSDGDQRTRVIPYCHTPEISCGGRGLLAYVTGVDHPTYQIIRSFLDDTLMWFKIGLSPSQALAAQHN
jgi:pimeloyl-ACP methyl ester carboxylesterase